MNWYATPKSEDILHYGIKGMKWRNKKGPQVKSVPHVRKKTAADLGAEVGADFKAQKLIKGQNKGEADAKKSVSPSRKRQIAAEVRRFFIRYENTKDKKYKELLKNKMNGYLDKLSKAEVAYARSVAGHYKDIGVSKYFAKYNKKGA